MKTLANIIFVIVIILIKPILVVAGIGVAAGIIGGVFGLL